MKNNDSVRLEKTSFLTSPQKQREELILALKLVQSGKFPEIEQKLGEAMRKVIDSLGLYKEL